MSRHDPNPATRYSMGRTRREFDRLAARSVSDNPELSDLYGREVSDFIQSYGAQKFVGAPERETVRNWWQRNRSNALFGSAIGAIVISLGGSIAYSATHELPASNPQPAVEVAVTPSASPLPELIPGSGPEVWHPVTPAPVAPG